MVAGRRGAGVLFAVVGARLLGPGVRHVLVDLADLAPPLVLDVERLAEELHGAGREAAPLGRQLGGLAPLPEHELLEVHVADVGVLPGEVAGQHAEEQHGQGPHVGRGADQNVLVAHGLAHLGRRVRDAAVGLADHAPVFASHAEVHQLDTGKVRCHHQHVFRLDVAVHQVLAVHELQGRGQLLHHGLGVRLPHAQLGRDGVEEVTEGSVFLGENEGRLGLEGHVVGVDDVAVWGEEVGELELALEVPQLRGRLGQQLQRHLGPRVSAPRQNHLHVQSGKG